MPDRLPPVLTSLVFTVCAAAGACAPARQPDAPAEAVAAPAAREVERFIEDTMPSDRTDTEYGIGWTVERDSVARRRVRHSGGSVGGTAHLIIYPEERVVVVLLVNSDRTFRQCDREVRGAVSHPVGRPLF